MVLRTIDFQASTVTLRTRAKGLLAKLAHDLEIAAEAFEGGVELDGEEWKSELLFPVRNLRVVGALRGDRVDRAVLSQSDREEIERKIRQEVLPVTEVQVSLRGNKRRCDATVRSHAGEQRVGVALTTEERRDGELVCYGTLTLSLRALGIKEVKAPLGAFKVDDAVEVAFWLMLEQTAP